ncbi:glycosyltransferase family 2 protein [Pseudomonas sp. dw_358]|uniref:glycosyltransferase family 2 protein n=1 Tax=Pseudomonas sp. dw_358 TaxID=2720083 RepID=UPI001BD41B58|nr:glycosyltransferase family 2 protein [Pseudomonas sp. dw_358]
MTSTATPSLDGESATPLVSIIAPCYNGEKYLEEALAGIYSQTYPNLEVIIVDDGSVDGSWALLERLQQVYGFQLYRQKNQGVSAALNHGLRYAQGKYVATPDLDDIMLPESVAVRVAFMEEHPETGICAGNSKYIDSEGKVLKEEKRRVASRYDFAETLADARVCGAPSALYRMEALKAAAFYDPFIQVQDFQITLRITHAGYFVDAIPILITLYRRHPNNLSRRYKKVLTADLAAIAPYRNHPAYESGRAALLHKALKYAVREDRADAWRLLRQVPPSQWNRVTFQRFKRLVLLWPRNLLKKTSA